MSATSFVRLSRSAFSIGCSFLDIARYRKPRPRWLVLEAHRRSAGVLRILVRGCAREARANAIHAASQTRGAMISAPAHLAMLRSGSAFLRVFRLGQPSLAKLRLA